MFRQAIAKPAAAALAVVVGSTGSTATADAPRRPGHKQVKTESFRFSKNGSDEGWETLEYEDCLKDLQEEETREACQLAQLAVEAMQDQQNSERRDDEIILELQPELAANQTANSTPDSEIDDVLILGTGQAASVMESAEQHMLRQNGQAHLRRRGPPSDVNFVNGRYFAAVNAALKDPAILAAFLNNPEIRGVMTNPNPDCYLEASPALPALLPALSPDFPIKNKQNEGKHGFDAFVEDVEHHVRSALNRAHQFVNNLICTIGRLGKRFQKRPSKKTVNEDIKVYITPGVNGNISVQLLVAEAGCTTNSATEARREAEKAQQDEDDAKFLHAVMAGTFLVLSIVVFRRLGMPLRVPRTYRPSF